ncbi:hypothetical protein BDP27DRAFT_1213458 [Rhodocollybia butyracea]|uniref:Hemimethylated DNA-binding domain-containing protein n=1 Tax=Rhodocollybia butyracea TaxID=206335 RepID=A0A9P5PYA7_9AGAR|nr:hypothetical protein BDP27DRAFT_1213458 [Rhodocollybia butyracea]
MIPPLPLDCLICILKQLPCSRDSDGEESVKTIVRCSAANALFQEAAALPILWQRHYQARYLYANDTEEVQRKADTGGNWRLVYFARRRIDKQVLMHLDAIVSQRVGRYMHAKSVAQYLFDVWDVLEIESAGSEHLRIYENDMVPSLSATRVYWASALLSSISRMYAVEFWGRCLRSDSSVPDSYVPAFSAQSSFFGKHPDLMHTLLTDLNSRCRDHLIRLKFPLSPDDPTYDLKKLCVLICEFMASEGHGPVQPHNFHDIHNHFPHFYLTSHKRSIPISLVHIFVSIARSLKVNALPVNFPVRVLVHISTPKAEDDDFYVDIYGASSKVIVSLREDIPALLARQGIVPNDMMRYISPETNAGPMLLRSVRNVTMSPINTSLSFFQPVVLLAYTVSLLMTRDERVVLQLLDHAEPLDCATFISESLIPCLEGADETQDALSKACLHVLDDEALDAKVIRLRSAENIVQYFVGMLFMHKRYPYKAVIIGWDVTTEEWITEMRVDELPRGRAQPFYSVVCDDSSRRYVAEDNIQPLLAPSDEFLAEMCRIITLPKFFTGVLKTKEALPLGSGGGGTVGDDIDASKQPSSGAKARFALSPELSAAYPEDEAIGEALLIG